MDLFTRVMETIFFSLLVFWETLAGVTDNRRSLSGGISPKMLIQPKSTILFDDDIKSNSTYLSCKATGHPLPTYRWGVDLGLGLREINSTGDRYFKVDTTNGELHLLNPEPSTHHGVYQCTAENPSGAVLSNTAFVEFGFLRQFTAQPRLHVAAQLGHAAMIACEPPEHYPEGLNYSWEKNNEPLNLTEHPDIFLSKEGDLYFSAPVYNDAAIYTCLVSHPKIPSAGTVKSPRIVMTVSRPPTPSSFMQPRILDNFPKFIKSTELPTTVMQIMLECVGEGQALNYHWSRANSPLTNETHTLEDRGRRLLVYVGQNHTDKYNCTVAGPLGAASKDLVLSLRELKPKRLTFKQGLKNKEVNTGERVIFQCETSVKTMITWHYNGQQFGPQMNNMADDIKEMIMINKTSSMSSALTIKHATPEIAGVYQCGAGDITRYIYSTSHLIVDRQYSGGSSRGYNLDLISATAILTLICQVFASRVI